MVRTRGAVSKETSASLTAYFRVLVTGANAGLGFATCQRIIDEFLASRPESQKLHLIASTRSSTKSKTTVSRLVKYVLKRHRLRASTATSSNDKARVLITAIELDLTYLPSIIRAARRLRHQISTLDAIICNAGLAGWSGLNWYKAILDTLRDLVQSTTWPEFTISRLGLRTGSQLRESEDAELKETEPALGEVFTANVFGHYILAHELGPLLSAAKPTVGRIIWVSSIEAAVEDLDLNDIQALTRDRAYNSSKQLTDYLALSSTLNATRSLTRSFLSDPSHQSYRPLNPQPRQYVSHPGVVSTDILPLPYIVAWAKRCSFRLARLLGSPWHTIDVYKGATAPVWLALAPQTTLDTLEEREGPGKWGSATDRSGNERVKRTEVEGWGWGGRLETRTSGGDDNSPAVVEKRTGRKRGARDLTQKQLDDFERTGVAVWKALEKLREDWYELLDDAEVIEDDDDDDDEQDEDEGDE